MNRWSLVLVIGMLVGCVPAGSPSVVDAGPVPSTPVDATCEKLAALGCPEGQDPGCPKTLANLRIRPIIAINEACVMRATTPADVAGCAGFRCKVAP